MLISLAGDIKRRFSFTLDNIDIGGGFGVPTIRGLGLKELILYRVLRQLLNPPNPHDTMPIGEAGKAIGGYFLRMRGELGLPQLRLFVEPGRSVVSSSHTLLLRVYEIKQIRNRKYVITDGGRFNCTFPMEHSFISVLLPTGRVLFHPSITCHGKGMLSRRLGIHAGRTAKGRERRHSGNRRFRCVFYAVFKQFLLPKACRVDGGWRQCPFPPTA